MPAKLDMQKLKDIFGYGDCEVISVEPCESLILPSNKDSNLQEYTIEDFYADFGHDFSD